MRSSIRLSTTIKPALRSSSGCSRPIPFLIVLAHLELLLAAQAVRPPPDGGYSNDNTAEGDIALFSLTTGFGNTAIGSSALYSTTAGGNNTATGLNALFFNATGDNNTASGVSALFF